MHNEAGGFNLLDGDEVLSVRLRLFERFIWVLRNCAILSRFLGDSSMRLWLFRFIGELGCRVNWQFSVFSLSVKKKVF